MKNIRLYVLLVLIMVVITACSPENVYKSEKNNFSMSYPKGWEKQSGVMATEVMFLAPKQSKDDKDQPNISVFAENNKADLKSYYQSVVEQLKKGPNNNNYKEISVSDVTIDGEPCTKNVYNITMGDFKLKNDTYVFKHNDKFFVIIFSATESRYDTTVNEAKSAIESFKFIK